MSYSIKKILNIVITAKKPKTKSFLFYDREKKVCCYTYWCYNVREEKMKLSELKPQYVPLDFHKDFYKKMKEELKNGGFDYEKGIITMKYRGENIIGDGHHRYFIMKDLFGPDYEVTTVKIIDKYNPWLHFLFINLIIKPIRLLYRIFNSIKTLIVNSLCFFLNKKAKLIGQL